MSRHNAGLQLLMERRQREEAARFYEEAAAADNLTVQHAAFENRTRQRFEAGEIRRREQLLTTQTEDKINERRAKLAALLKADDERYQTLLENSTETPKMRRLRLMEQLNKLRAIREQEHDAYVQEKNEQAWRDQCDPLRHQISEALEKQVIAERDKQVIAHDIARMESEQDELKYVEALKESTKEWNEMLAREKEENRLRQRENKRIWESEMRVHEEKRKQEKQREYEESLQFRTTLEAAERQAQEAAATKAAAQLARRQELDTLNKDQIARKKRAIQEEKELDEKYTNQAVEELRQQEEDELVAKLVAHRKSMLNGQLLGTQQNLKKESDDIAERYIQAAVEEVNRKEDQLRAQDAEKRRKLMLESVEDRKKTMALHLEQRRQRQLEKIQEGKQLDEDIAMKKQLDLEEMEAKRRLIRNQYAMLESQSKLKKEYERQRKQEEQDAVNATIAGWKAEETKIQEELANPHFVAGGRFRGHR